MSDQTQPVAKITPQTVTLGMVSPTQRGKIMPQVQTTTTITATTILVDDAAMLVDGTSLVGSQTTPVPILRISTGSNAPSPTITIRR